jgi:hypothetical protein
MSVHQNAEQNYNLLTGNKSLECMANDIYFGMAVGNQIFIHEKLRSDKIQGVLVMVQLKMLLFPSSL